jgi:hypothetical protein
MNTPGVLLSLSLSMNHQLAPMPSLVRCPTVESLGERAVEDVDCRHYRLSPEGNMHFPLLEEGPSHPHNQLVAPLDDAVLLRVVRRGVVALNTLIRVVRHKFSRREFAAVVGAQHVQLAVALCLRSDLRAYDGVRSLSLAAKDHNPHVAGEVIDEQQEVASSSGCSHCHRATQVLVHELEPLLGSEARLLVKGEPPLLHQHIDIVELLHVVKARQASYHPLGTEPLQGLEVKVPEALVPLPLLIVPTSSKTEGLYYLHVEDIESIGASGYLGKKATMVIPNPHDSILDLHTRTALIQLSQADDRVP